MKIQLCNPEEILPFLQSMTESINTKQKLVVNLSMFKSLSNALASFIDNLAFNEIFLSNKDKFLFKEIKEIVSTLRFNILRNNNQYDKSYLQIFDEITRCIDNFQQYQVGLLGQEPAVKNSEDNMQSIVKSSEEFLNKIDISAAKKFIQID